MIVKNVSATLLVVEHESLIRMDALDALENAGFMEAANADEALDILSSRGDVDVVFTDVNMPGSIDGFGLMRRIAVERPEIVMIVASGVERPTHASLPPRTHFFAKPYVFDRIVEAINSLRAA